MPFNYRMQYTYFLLISGIKGNLWWHACPTAGSWPVRPRALALSHISTIVYVVMVVLLVQNSVNHSVLKVWGLHPLDELATLAEVLEQFKRGEIEPALCSLMLSWSSRSSATSLQICLGRFRQFI